MPPEALHEREHKRLRYLAAKMLDDLKDAKKIFVYQRPPPLADVDIIPLYRALRAYGPNKLLWVTLADDQHPSGYVELTADGLIRGHIDHFADPARVPSSTSVEAWSIICSNTLHLCGCRSA